MLKWNENSQFFSSILKKPADCPLLPCQPAEIEVAAYEMSVSIVKVFTLMRFIDSSPELIMNGNESVLKKGSGHIHNPLRPC